MSVPGSRDAGTELLTRRLSGILGGKTADALRKKLGLSTVDDLLRYYPRRYAERGELTALGDFDEGEQVTILGVVVKVETRTMRQRRGTILEATVSDGVEEMRLTFFNQKWREKQLVPGRRGLFAGQVSRYRGRLQLAHPEFELLPEGAPEDDLAAMQFAGALIPIYPAVRGITSWQISQAIDLVLAQIGDLIDPLPADVCREHELIGFADALSGIHRPASREELDAAIARLRFEEAFVLQVLLAQRRAETRALTATRRAPDTSPLVDAFDARLPFALTDGQIAVSQEIAADLAADHPMHRLLQGDVGSGKTVVALRAMLRVVDAGGQAALLAPTEVLAAQHSRSITGMLGPLAERGLLGGSEIGTRVTLLTGSQRTADRRRALLEATTGEAGIIVGTHALLQEHVEFDDLALVVVDEQHRFGVEQRAALAEKSRAGTRPHVLVMTATPIPRTVAMTVFGDVDVSTLQEVPTGRAGVTTHIVVPAERPALAERTWQRVREEVDQDHRVFIVCPRIGDEAGDSDGIDPEVSVGDRGAVDDERRPSAVVEVAQMLTEGPLAGLRIGILHGRMAPEEKDDVMRRFSDVTAADGIDVLVSTTVIEVGVDVPDATMMVIMDADRFGISQLHQLRGRVGRGSLPGLCLLVTDSPDGSPARERLAAVASTTDGFELSNLDLELRREGDVLGSSQSGIRRTLRLLEVARHEDIINNARADAHALVEQDPTLQRFPALAHSVRVLVEEEQAEFLEKA